MICYINATKAGVNEVILTELDLLHHMKSLTNSLLNMGVEAKYELMNELVGADQYMSGYIDDYLLSRYLEFLTKLIEEYGENDNA